MSLFAAVSCDMVHCLSPHQQCTYKTSPLYQDTDHFVSLAGEREGFEDRLDAGVQSCNALTDTPGAGGLAHDRDTAWIAAK